MIILGTVQRQIYPQGLINWAATFVPNTNNGYLNFIFSGDGGAETLFSLNGGKLLSPNNNLIGGYSSLETLNFSGNINGSTIDLYQDNVPLYLGQSRATSGAISAVVLSASNNSSIDFRNLTMLGDIPEIQGPVNPFLILYPNEPVPFTIINSGN